MADFKTVQVGDHYGNDAECTLLDQLKVANQVRLAGGVFNDSILDPNFFTATTSAGGTATVANSVLTLSVNATSGSTAGVASNAAARYLGSSSNFYRGNVRLATAGTAGNKRYWGAFNGASSVGSGYFFLMDGTTFKVGHKAIGSAEVTVSSGAFNGKVASFDPGITRHTYEIYYTTSRAQLVADGVLLHEFSQTDTPLTGDLHLKPNALNVNTGVVSAVNMHLMASTISRLGEALGNPVYKHVSGAATTLCKTGPGGLHRIVVGTPKGTCTVYDSTTGSGSVLSVIDLGSLTVPMSIDFGIDFTTGLTLVTTSTSDITAVYE